LGYTSQTPAFKPSAGSCFVRPSYR